VTTSSANQNLSPSKSLVMTMFAEPMGLFSGLAGVFEGGWLSCVVCAFALASSSSFFFFQHLHSQWPGLLQ
jgi:hypothetical protein